LHGLIERWPHTHRYQVTEFGWRVALFFTRTYARVIRPGLAQIVPHAPPVAAHSDTASTNSKRRWMTGLLRPHWLHET